MNLLKRIARRPIRRYLEHAVARLIRRNPKLQVVAVGGSVGKTSTKTAVSVVLGQGRRVLTSHSNYNSEFGSPLAIFGLRAPDSVTNISAWLRIIMSVRITLMRPFPYDVLVVELGSDKPGDIAAFMRYLVPDIAVVTAITPEHMATFGTLAAVGDEEFTLARSARAVALHTGDPELMKRRRQLDDKPVITYGSDAEVRWIDDTHIDLGAARGGTIEVMPQVYSGHLHLSLLAAAAIAAYLGLSSDQIRRGVNAVEPVPGRMQRLVGKNGVTIIDDTYNSSPDAVLAALRTVYGIDTPGRRIALLGQMNELGDYSAHAHSQVGKAAANLDLLVTLAGDANTILGPAAVTAGLAASHLKAFDSPYAAGEWLSHELTSGDVLLVKGSQNGVYAEEAIKVLLKHPADAAQLVRQSSEWLAKKASQFPDAPR